jgi:hypothetical protein
MESLEILCGSKERVHLMRFFLLGSETPHDLSSLVKKTSLERILLKKEIKTLLLSGFLKTKIYTKEEIKKGVKTKEKGEGYIINPNFVFLNEFKSMLLSSGELSEGVLISRLQKLGTISTVILSGVFTGGGEVDILIAGEKLKKEKIEEELTRLGTVLGKDLSFVILDNDEFVYRQMMFDRFLREFLAGDIKVLRDTQKYIKEV